MAPAGRAMLGNYLVETLRIGGLDFRGYKARFLDFYSLLVPYQFFFDAYPTLTPAFTI